MNHTYRLVYSASLKMFVVASELARGRGKSSKSGTVRGNIVTPVLAPSLLTTRQFKLSLCALGMMFAHDMVSAQQLPAGAILDINNGTASNTGAIANTFRDYSIGFTASQTGSNYLLFAFRQDPAYWTFGNVSLVESGSSTNLLVNPNFIQGGTVGNSGIQAPANWGITYQTGRPPRAAGTWNAPGSGNRSSSTGLGVNTSTSGSWYDGAVGSFDGIYQGVSLNAGTAYNVSFSALSNNNANTSSVRMGVYVSPCSSVLVAPVDCDLDPSSGFTTLFQPSQTTNAGTPPVVVPPVVVPPTITIPTTASSLSNNNILDGGTLVADGTSLAGKDFSITGSDGIIDTKSFSSEIASPITDNSAGTAGSLRIIESASGGDLKLSGINTYTGSTTVDSGAKLVLTADGSIAASSGLTNNGTLDIAAANNGAALNSLDGNGNVVLGAKVLRLDNATGNFAGNVSGLGGVQVNGGGETLSGINTYTGTTVVANGATITLAGNGSIADSSAVETNGTLDISTTNAGANITSLAGNGGVVLGAKDLTLTNASTDFSGTIAGNGGLNINGGTQVLSGTNTYAGPTTIGSGGTLQIASDASLGDAVSSVVLNGGRLRTTTGIDTTRNIVLPVDSRIDTLDGTILKASGVVAGAGRIIKEGTGTLVLSGDNSNWTGGTTIDAGVLRIESANSTGIGDITLNAGTIDAATTFTTQQKLSLASNTRFNTQLGTTTTLTGDVQSIDVGNANMGGAGDNCFIKSGAGTLNLGGVATLDYGTCVEDGVLQANGVLNSVVTVYEGAALRGTGLITGPIAVNGTLAPGNSPGTLNVRSTITMAPTSTLQADINGLGTASGPGNYSRLLIEGAGNQLVINEGATLAPNLVAITGTDTYTPYVPAVGDSFRIVTAEGGIVGRFAPLVQPAGLEANTRMAAYYDVQNNKSLDLRVIPLSYGAYFDGANSNIRSVASVLDNANDANLNAVATPSQLALAYTVAGANTAQLSGLATALSGQIHGALAAVAPLAGQSLQTIVSKQLVGSSATTSQWTGSQSANSRYSNAVDVAKVAPAQALWVDLSANHARWDNDSKSSSFTANRTQLTLGADIARGDAGRFGAGLSYARSNVSATAGSGSVEQRMVFLYGEYAVGKVVLDGLASYGSSTWDSERRDPLQFSGTVNNDPKGRDSMVSIGARAPWQVGDVVVEPFARVAFQRSRRDGFQENTATPAALQLPGYSANGTRVMAGLSGSSKVRDPLAGQSTMRYAVGVGRDNGDLLRPEVGASLAGTNITISTPQVGRAFVQANAEVTAAMGKMSYAYFGLAGDVRSGKTDVGVTGGVRVLF